MVENRLTEAVVRRLQELGLPPSLMDLEQFREHFIQRRWVMFVRDCDPVVDVHLCEPGKQRKAARRDRRKR
jgi:hypothetical protein